VCAGSLKCRTVCFCQ